MPTRLSPHPRRRSTRRLAVAAEVLEVRVVPASVSLAGGALAFVADFGEANAVTVDLVNVGGTDYVRIRDDGPGVVIHATGAGLVVDASNLVRAPLAGLTGLNLSTQPLSNPENPGEPDLVDDSLRLVLASALPPTISVDLGPSTSDSLTVAGTSGDDSFDVKPSWSAEGARVLELRHGGTLVQIGDAEDVSFDLTGGGEDVLTLDRYVAGLERPTAFHVAGGGSGHDSLVINGTGIVPQTVDLTDGHIVVRDTPPSQELLLGRSDNVAIDQPRVTIDPITFDSDGNPVPIIPEDSEGRYFLTILLDTGANSILAAQELSSTLIDAGMQVDGKYREQGVAGFQDVDVSAPYRIDFAGNSGIRNTINDFRMELSDESFSLFGPYGLAGMPLMVNRVTTLDMSAWEHPELIVDPADLEIKVDFSQSVPADSGHFYHVPLQLVNFPPSGAYPGNPIPTFAPLPEIRVKIRENGKEVDGYFLLDTGAQLSILSTDVAFALGLDRNGNGSLDDEAVDHIEVGGIGGTTSIPLLPVDRVAVPTDEGTDLVWDKLLLGIEDIEVPDGPKLLGVFGMDYLTSGWAAKILPLLLGFPGTEANGFFSHIYLDFRDAANLRGTMVLDVTPEHDTPGVALPSTLDLTHTGLDSVRLSTGGGDDLVQVDPSAAVAYQLDGGPHDNGDTLFVNVPPGLSATNDGSTIRVPGYQDITFAHFESVNVAVGSDTTPPTAAIDPVAPDPRATSVASITIRFSEPVVGLDLDDLALTRDGQTVALAGASVSTVNASTYILGNLDGLTASGGHYVLTLVASGSGIADLAGNPLALGASDDWTTDATPPTAAIDPVAPDPRATSVASITIRFSEPVVGFDLADLALTRDGQAVGLSGASLALVDETTYALIGLDAATSAPGVYALTLVAGGSGITDPVGNPLALDASEIWTNKPTLMVSAIFTDATGFTVVFNQPIDPSKLNLYGAQKSRFSDADVVLLGPSGPVVGSLLLDASGTTLSFLKTGGLLDDGTYTITLRSGSRSIRALDGSPLDGNADGTPGDDYTHPYDVTSAPGQVVVSVPDFARGPGQEVHLPATSTTGIPFRLSDGAGVTSLVLSLGYDPAQLTLGAATLAPGLPGSLSESASGPGFVTYTYTSPTPLGAGAVTLFTVAASVPDDADYAAKDLLDLHDASINGGQKPAVEDDGLHLVAYIGDADGSGDYSARDASLIARQAFGRDSGFAAFQNADPIVVADVNGDGVLNRVDGRLVARKAVFQSVPLIPDLPGVPVSFTGGPDPTLTLPRGLLAVPGQPLPVALTLTNSDPGPITLLSGDLALSYDPSRFTVIDVTAGSLPVGDWLEWSADPATGMLFITTAGNEPLTMPSGESGTLVVITLLPRPGAEGGMSPLNLLAVGQVSAGSWSTRLNNGALTLNPAPTNAPTDPGDGQIWVSGAVATGRPPGYERLGAGRRWNPSAGTIDGRASSTVWPLPSWPSDALDAALDSDDLAASSLRSARRRMVLGQVDPGAGVVVALPPEVALAPPTPRPPSSSPTPPTFGRPTWRRLLGLDG